MDREGVIILLTDKNNRIAWQLRDDDPNVQYANHWGLFGGWIERGEDPQTAVLREMKEELSISLEIVNTKYIGKYYIFPNVIAHIFEYRIDDQLNNAILCEGQEFRFWSLDEISGKLSIPKHYSLANWYLDKNKGKITDLEDN